MNLRYWDVADFKYNEDLEVWLMRFEANCELWNYGMNLIHISTANSVHLCTLEAALHSTLWNAVAKGVYVLVVAGDSGDRSRSRNKCVKTFIWFARFYILQLHRIRCAHFHRTRAVRNTRREPLRIDVSVSFEFQSAMNTFLLSFLV